MNKFLYPLLLLPIALGACKKSSTVYTTMSVTFDADSSWTTTNVVTQNAGNGSVYITGTSSDQSKIVSLIINGDYRAGAATYTILYTGTSPSYLYNSAEYQYGTSAFIATTGQIVVSAYSAKTISGSFSFAGTNAVTGTFTAATP